MVESARSAVPVLPPVRFCEPLAEPGVHVSMHRARRCLLSGAVDRVPGGWGSCCRDIGIE